MWKFKKGKYIKTKENIYIFKWKTKQTKQKNEKQNIVMHGA